MAKPKPSVPNYGLSTREMLSLYRTVVACEICGTRKDLYKFKLKGKSKFRCSCRKHLRRIK